jgi:pimeloyl-ACP methyl ester carboxylesterase
MYSETTALNQSHIVVFEIPATGQSHQHLIWGHGWGQSSAVFVPLAEALKPFASSTLIDFPGFGKSALPPASWGTAEYADAVAQWLQSQPRAPLVWIGHSFGGRVGIQLAARHPQLLAGMVLIASAGLPRQRTFFQQIRFSLRKTFFKMAKRFLREGPQLERLRQQMGSADYRSAGALRPVLNRVVGEDLTETARRVQCPTLLIYGNEDTETPSEMGQQLKGLIPGAELALLDGFGHLNILNEGRHQVALRIRKFLQSLPQ